MFHNFEKACHYEERCSKDTPIIVYGKRAGDRSRICVRTSAKTTYGDDTKITDTSNSYEGIVMTIYTK